MSTLLVNKTGIIIEPKEREDKRRRRLLWLLLLLLLLLLVSVSGLFVRYVINPAPLPDILPLPVKVNYSPHYLFSIYGVEKPVGVAISPEGDRIYVAETGDERLVKIFDQEGNPLGSFMPPRTISGQRSPVYLATDNTGRVFVSDRLQHAIFVYDRDGVYLDTILGPDLTLSEYVSQNAGDSFDQAHDESSGIAFAYNAFEPNVYYQIPGENAQVLPAPDPVAWSPLGLRIEKTGNMLLTDVTGGRHTVHVIPSGIVLTGSWQGSTNRIFGAQGQGDGQFSFPNSAVTDSRGRIYVTDSNNSRISVWDEQGNFLFHFGQGAGRGALGLPRGAIIDGRNRLHVVDTVEQCVKVYDVSGDKPSFLFAFGDWGMQDGQFNYPNDIALDAAGRFYVADRENNRIQVWSY